jgi:hypothetical protein
MMNNGIELPFLFAVVAVAIAFSGGGAFSLDTLPGFGFLHEPYVVHRRLYSQFLEPLPH